jgi:hypothetical protein
LTRSSSVHLALLLGVVLFGIAIRRELRAHAT